MNPEHLKLVRKIAWNLYKRNINKIEYKEILAQCLLHYSEAIQIFDPSLKVKETTFLWVFINNSMINFCKKEIQYQTNQRLILPEDEFIYSYKPFYEFYESISEDCKKLTDFILNISDPILKRVSTPEKEILSKKQKFIGEMSPTKAQRFLKKLLLSNGWELEEINMNFDKFSKFLQISSN